MGMDRKKIIRTEDRKADAIGIGYNVNVTTNNSNKPLPTGEVIKVVGAEEQFQKERKESTNYRLTATINTTMYYPQDYHWIGTWNSSYELQEDVDETFETDIFKDWNYLLPNILSPDSINPTEEDFRIDKIINWVGHVVYPYENDYLKLYELPSFSVNVDFLPSNEDGVLSIDTGITNILYNDILIYLDEYVTIWPGVNLGNTSIENYFDPSKPVIPPLMTDVSTTLKISNKEIKGYTQDGVPFLFTVPVPTENGWKTALYVPFKHNFEEGDYIFIKPIASDEVGDEYSNCDPTLYGFKRVLETSWGALSEATSLNYIIIDHKTEYHWDWTTLVQGENTEGEDYPWTVTSSQGFIKRVINYSDSSTLPITIEDLNNGHFSPSVNDPLNAITVTLLVPHNLKVNDFTLITVSEDALGTDFNNDKKPTLFNLSGIYTVIDVLDNYSFDIRAKSQQDLIAFFNGAYTDSQLVASPTNYYIECYKLLSVPSEYYLRKGKIINSINNFDVSDLPMSNSIFMDKNYNAVIDEDINTKGLVDNWGLPITQLYVLLTKRAGQLPYDFTDVETFFSWKFNYRVLLSKTGDGLDVVSRRSDTDNRGGYVKDSGGGYMDEFDEYLGDWYYIDFSEFNNNLLLEKQVTTLSNRFNGAQRECGGAGDCNYEVYANDFDGIMYNAWSVYTSYNTSNLAVSQVGGKAKLVSTTSWVSPNAQANYGGNFIRTTFMVTPDLVGETLVLKVNYEQESSTGMIRIFNPGGNQMILGNGSYGKPVGNAANLTVPSTNSANDYTVSFIPTVVGNHTIALGLMNYVGGLVGYGDFIGYYDNLEIIKYYGTPQYAGWVYDPLTEYQLQVWSSYIETADPNVLGIPYWAKYIDGLYFWRDLLSVGYFEDVDQTLGVDYPFLNGSHYINKDKNLMVSLSPYKLNESGTSQIIFGCMDINATNYNTVATYACGSIVDQGGPCVEDALGILQTDTPGVGNYNANGCCCQYDGGNAVVNVLTEGDKFVARTKKIQNSYNNVSGPSPAYDVGDQMIGWNICRGIYPFWKDATYWGTNFADYIPSESYPTVKLPTLTKLAGVMVGEDNPAFNVSIINGSATYDVFRYENYTADPNFSYLYGDLGNGLGSPLFTAETGRYQELFDLGQGSYGLADVPPSGSWTIQNDNGLSTWNTTINDTNGDSISPEYFSHNLFEFYKFDTSQCKTCFNQGSTLSTGDYLAPRHGWPVDVNNDGVPTATDINGNGIPHFQTLPLPGNQIARSTGTGSDLEGYAGIVSNTVVGSETVNIAAHRIPSDPNNWKMFYGTCVSTWACMVDAEKGIWPTGSSYPTCADPSCTNEADCISPLGCNSTWGPLPTQTWTTDELVNNCKGGTNCQRQCSCVNPAGGSLFGNYYGTSSSAIGGPILPLEQPTQFFPNVPPNMVNNYEFRGRVNIEMGINYDGYEKYYNSGSIDQGWAVAGPNTGGPPITYNNPWMDLGFSCADPTCLTEADCVGSGAGQCSSTWSATLPSTTTSSISQTLAASMAVTDGYKKYTRLYSGFWIGIVSEKCGVAGPGTGTEKCTYIYDPDDGTEGGGAGAPIYQSDGWGGAFTNVKWNHGCGGWKMDGITEAVNKMAYSPCRDNSNGYADCNVGDPTATNYDVINYQGPTYLPSCGENGSTSSKSDFQKIWSQSFKSESIPMHEGDKAFIFIRSVGGVLRPNNSAVDAYGSQNVTINGSSVQVETYLPTYWGARLINSEVA